MYLVGLKLWNYPLLQVVFRTVDDTRVSISILGSKHKLSDASPEQMSLKACIKPGKPARGEP